jgi:hypothetical protein
LKPSKELLKSFKEFLKPSKELLKLFQELLKSSKELLKSSKDLLKSSKEFLKSSKELLKSSVELYGPRIEQNPEPPPWGGKKPRVMGTCSPIEEKVLKNRGSCEENGGGGG